MISNSPAFLFHAIDFTLVTADRITKIYNFIKRILTSPQAITVYGFILLWIGQACFHTILLGWKARNWWEAEFNSLPELQPLLTTQPLPPSSQPDILETTDFSELLDIESSIISESTERSALLDELTDLNLEVGAYDDLSLDQVLSFESTVKPITTEQRIEKFDFLLGVAITEAIRADNDFVQYSQIADENHIPEEWLLDKNGRPLVGKIRQTRIKNIISGKWTPNK